MPPLTSMWARFLYNRQEYGLSGKALPGERLRADPRYALAHFDLGNVLDETGRIREAMQTYKTALQLAPTYADAHYNLALASKRSSSLARRCSTGAPISAWTRRSHRRLALKTPKSGERPVRWAEAGIQPPGVRIKQSRNFFPAAVTKTSFTRIYHGRRALPVNNRTQ